MYIDVSIIIIFLASSSCFKNKFKYWPSVVVGSCQWWLLLLNCAIYYYILSLLILFVSFVLKLYLADINIAIFTFILFTFSWYLFANSISLYVMLKVFLRVFFNVTSGCVLFYKEICCLCLFVVESCSFTFYTVTDKASVLLGPYFMFTTG